MSEIMGGVLRMPPELWGDDPLNVAQRHRVYVEAADTIDRQHAEIAALKAELDEDIGVINVWRKRTERAEDERDALLEALTEIVSAADGDGWKQLDATFASARAAIAKATGGNDE